MILLIYHLFNVKNPLTYRHSHWYKIVPAIVRPSSHKTSCLQGKLMDHPIFGETLLQETHFFSPYHSQTLLSTQKQQICFFAFALFLYVGLGERQCMDFIVQQEIRFPNSTQSTSLSLSLSHTLSILSTISRFLPRSLRD